MVLALEAAFRPTYTELEATISQALLRRGAPESSHSAHAQLRTFDRSGIVQVMAAIIDLSPGEQMPARGDDEPRLIVNASDDGRFFGTDAAWKPSGEWVGYGSLPKNDGALSDALAAAER